ncbi:MAG TPA: S8 family serine peptidase [Jatrophihabitans sp.]|uniref:S8 family serine peptidase n=1 Tax=Jatrophihabitans sp. TaxID=1932789 RepID=UPI002E09586E|nr:S8 family serine peptidase [Jatrophihabitans sp.]
MAALSVGALLVPTTASADPATPAPVGPVSADRLQRAVAQSSHVVFLVHTTDTHSGLRSAIAGAGSAHLAVRHRFPAQHLFSVEVTRSAAAATRARLAALPGVASVETSAPRFFSGTPDDPRFGSQSAYLDAIAAPAAWSRQHGSASVRIAVVDSGIDVGHPDLAGKVVATYDARTGGTDITDTLGHGTFVAGVAAAATDNGVGIAGAGYDTTLLGAKIAAPDGSITIDDEVAGIRWAVAHGASVINLSLGGPVASAAERSAVAYAQSKGVLVVAAAGNDADSTLQYPGAYPGVVSVGAIDTTARSRADFSTYGSWVTLAAPGVNLVSTTPLAGSDFFSSTTGYGQGDGTSFASPLVAGEAALLRAENPTMSLAALRHALVASAHGYTGLGLGAGQVDFALALRHVPPTSRPTAIAAVGTAGAIRLTARTTAPRVAFRVDGHLVATAAAIGGTATATWPSFGYANGPHTLQALDCTEFGECAATSAASPFPVENSAPVVTSPAPGRTVTGRFLVSGAHPGGGGVALLVDGRLAGFDSRAPYGFAVNGSVLTRGAHSLQLRLCDTTRTRCASPSSPVQPVSVVALHPSIAGLSPITVSPNADGRQDAATLTFTLPDAENVTIDTIDRYGRVVARNPLGYLTSGRRTFVWRARAAGGRTLPDGRYSLAVTSRRSVDGAELRGWASRVGIVDTRAPRLTSITGNRTLFYPRPDRFRDLFSPHVTLDGRARLSLTIRTPAGSWVRTISVSRGAGPTYISWNGIDRHGHFVPAGRYLWEFRATDSGGNSVHTPQFLVTVSARRLVTVAQDLTLNGAAALEAGGTDPACASARTARSAFPHGVLLSNACADNGYDLAFADYVFTLPSAVRFGNVAIRAYGHSRMHPSELTASVQRSDGGLEVPRYITISSGLDRWYTIATIPAAGHVTPQRQMFIALVLDSLYRGRNDFDVKYAQLHFTYTTLR